MDEIRDSLCETIDILTRVECNLAERRPPPVKEKYVDDGWEYTPEYQKARTFAYIKANVSQSLRKLADIYPEVMSYEG